MAQANWMKSDCDDVCNEMNLVAMLYLMSFVMRGRWTSFLVMHTWCFLCSGSRTLHVFLSPWRAILSFVRILRDDSYSNLPTLFVCLWVFGLVFVELRDAAECCSWHMELHWMYACLDWWGRGKRWIICWQVFCYFAYENLLT